MDEPISYAMRNTEALGNWLNFNAPSELKDWSFLAIEFILVVGTICTILHAVRHYKENGSYSALLTLLSHSSDSLHAGRIGSIGCVLAY